MQSKTRKSSLTAPRDTPIIENNGWEESLNWTEHYGEANPRHSERTALSQDIIQHGERDMTSVPSFTLIDPQDWYFKNNPDVARADIRASEYLEENGSLVNAEYHIEEFVRQWALRFLIENYDYPPEWIGERILIEYSVMIASRPTEADIVIRNTNRRPYLFIECKNRGASQNDFDRAEEQLESYLSATHTATIGMVTDGVRVKVKRKKIDPNDFEYLPDFPKHNSSITPQTRLMRTLPPVGDARATGLKRIEPAYDRVLFDCHNILRDVDGLHDDEALDELCKVIYAKIFDERTTTGKEEGTPFRFQTYGAANASEVASEIRALYEDARQDDINIYSKRIPGYERSRGVFNQQIRLSDVALFRIVEGVQDYSLVDSTTDIKGTAFQKVLAPAVRAGMGQYFTPDPIVELAVEIVQPKASDLILDPFCGSGHFLTKCLSYVVRNQSSKIPEHDMSQFKFFHLHGIEKSDRMVRIAMTDMLLHDDGHTNVRNTDSLLSFDNYPDLTGTREDWNRDPAIFDIVLTNPPFGSTMTREAMDMLGRFDLGHGRKSLPLEVLGLERSCQFLKPGGRLAIILPEHLLKGKSNRYVRQWLFRVGELKAVISFPEDAFKPFGATVRTCLCVFRKFETGETPNRKAPAFLCEVENLGYDATGRAKDGSEIPEVAKSFLQNVGWCYENTD